MKTEAAASLVVRTCKVARKETFLIDPGLPVAWDYTGVAAVRAPSLAIVDPIGNLMIQFGDRRFETGLGWQDGVGDNF